MTKRMPESSKAEIHPNVTFKVGIIGGGVAGSTIALRLAALGVQTYLFESKTSLIDGPPMCHLHAGGNLYREIPDEDCVELLKQSIDMLRLYPFSIDVRPTVIAIPLRDDGNPNDLIPRLELLTNEYTKLIKQDPHNKVLGEPEDYFKLYSRDDLETLIKTKPQTEGSTPVSTDEWVAAAALHLDLDKLKFPIVAVNEYGWNIFRLAASAQTALEHYPNMDLMLNTKVVNVIKDENTECTSHQWNIDYVTGMNEINAPLADNSQPLPERVTVDFLINACGFRTGIIDNKVGIPVKRMVEFKASYVTHWENLQSESDSINFKPLKLPEIIIHGKRGTPHGMVQLTPYPEGYYQIHSMNKAVTLFNDGLVASTKNDAQPELSLKYLKFIDAGWNPQTLNTRTQRAIQEVSEFVPRFATAKPTNNALYGGQQIPGSNDTLRVADISIYPDIQYARAENIKASSALIAADELVNQLVNYKFISEDNEQNKKRQHHLWKYLESTSKQDIDELSLKLAKMRSFPIEMSGVVNPLQ